MTSPIPMDWPPSALDPAATTLTADEDAAERAFGYGILSLDLATPGFEALGLAPIDAGLFVRALRQGHDRGVAAGADAAAIVHAIVRETRASVRDLLGSAVERDFERWFELVWLGASRDPQANVWNSLVTFGRLDGSRDMRQVPAVVRELREAISRWPRAPALGRWPQSDRDRAMFEELGYETDPALADPDGSGPMVWVHNRVSHAAFCHAWETVVVRSADRERAIEELWRFRRHEAVLLDIPIQHIARPRDWSLPRFQR